MFEPKKQYERLRQFRHPYITRAEESAKYTIPALMPPEHSGGKYSQNNLYQPYQSLGSRGVNSLAANLLMTLLPPNQSFFRLVIDDKAKEELEDPAIVAEIEKNLAKIERTVQKEIEINAYRPSIHEALRLLVVTGNALLHLDKEGNMRTFRLDNYVVQRAPDGSVHQVILREEVYRDTLDPAIVAALPPASSPEMQSDETLSLYTCAYYLGDEDKYVSFQSVENVPVPDSQVTYKKGELPFMALRFTRVEGEDYGRSFVEENIGDMRSLEGLSQAILEGAAASAKVLFLVSPNGTTKARTLAQSDNGAIVQGSANDVTVLQVQKHADMQVALQTIQLIKDRLGKAFMITSDLFRDAERVTATEIQAIIRQVERTLGGLFSLLSSELQLPMVKLLLKNLEKRKQIPKLPKSVHPTIVVGVDAIGRAAELEKLDTLLAGMGQLFGPEALSQYINLDEYISRRATALGVPVEGLVKTQEQMQQEQQQAMMMQMAQQGGNALASEGGVQAAQGMAQQQQQPQGA